MGAAVGCAAAWHLPGDGEAGRWGLLHSMTLTPTLHGSGLAKPLLSNALGLMRHFHNGCALQTEGHRLAAIKLYLDFGFLPDPADFDGLLVWQAISRELRHPQLSAFISFFSSLQQ
eukprot:GGOE01004159.1.p2 GENE.GGOE01004159.1~~GGOE01004159.1.p2  ORF type:complete len:116 (-),score=22.85 GGOE01004159.1:110-457(-)